MSQVKSKAKSAWLKKVRKTSTKAKAFVGRGSHTMCMAQFKGCRRGQAKVARPEIKDILVAQYGQATALCKYCQTVVQERLKNQRKSPKQRFIIAAPQLATQHKKLKSDIRQASSQPVGGTEERLAPNGFQAIQLQSSWQKRP